MTGQDWEQHGLEYYNEKPKKGGGDQGAKMASAQPVLEKEILNPKSVEKGSDSSVANALFGSMWVNIHGLLERSDGACKPVVVMMQVGVHIYST